MGRYKKKEMLETIKTLEKANNVISRNNKANQANVLDALTQCQESAILLGTYIEILGEKYAYLVRILEDYCENIYQMSNGLSDDNRCSKLSKKIQKQLIQLHNGIYYDLPEDNKEAVFLPYKASMWDSLESVWKAADEDENCITYVIPIPYFDKNPDGSFREMHYEGDQYPEYVPITNYEEYNFEEQKPDMIFIHNPYDDCNFVTSVHPFFYSKNLKQFTDKLVYIPYFILDEIRPDNQAAIEGIKHFCTTPGVFYADKVVVQSEEMRQIYINVLTETIQAKETRQYWEDKILGIGSPKVDKLLNTRKEDLTIPDEWLKIIQRPDGSWKKIIFYNISVTALLENSVQMLEKIKNVFSVFKENKNEVVLLLRPHPLIESTFTSMRPQLWDKYKKIRDKYISEGWGIYDNSPDLSRAIELSDAYFGDTSSLVALYKKINKPVMLQNEKIFYSKEEEKKEQIKQEEILFFWDFFYDGVNVWISSISYRCLFRFHAESGKGEVVSLFDEEDTDVGLHNQIVQYNEYLVFVPTLAKKIAIYNTNNNEMKYVSAVNEEMYSKGLKISGTIMVEDKLLLFPQLSSQNLLILNLKTWDVEESTYFSNEIKKHNVRYMDCELGIVIADGNSAWIPVRGTNSIIEYNYHEEKMQIHEFMDEKIKIYNIEKYYEGLLVTLVNESRIIKWNIRKKLYEEIRIEIEWDRNLTPFSRAINTGRDSFIVLPAHAENIILVKNGQYKILDYPKGFDWIDDFKALWSRMLYCKVTENFVYIMPTVGNMMIKYNFELEKLDGIECKITDPILINTIYDKVLSTKNLKYLIERGSYIKENNIYNIEHFLNCIKKHKQNKKNDLEICGTVIYKELC